MRHDPAKPQLAALVGPCVAGNQGVAGTIP